MPLLYPSILFQERVLGFAMGGLVGMGVLMYEQREIWRSTAGLAETLSGEVSLRLVVFRLLLQSWERKRGTIWRMFGTPP